MIGGKLKDIQSMVQDALAAGAAPKEILERGLLPGMDVVSQRFKVREIYIPEVLLSAAAMKNAMAILKPRFVTGEVRDRGTVVIGTVKGDLHDIGKTLVTIMLEAGGFRVVDLGTNVAPERFLQAVRDEQAQVVGMSAMLTTTMLVMKDVIALLAHEGMRDRVKVIVGGAPVNAAFAGEIGADAYAEDATIGVELVGKLVGAA